MINTTSIDLSQLNAMKLSSTDTSSLEDKKLKKVCDDFESFFMQQLMDISLKNSSMAGEGTGSDIIKGMYTDTMARSSAGSLGISTMLFEFLSNNKKEI